MAFIGSALGPLLLLSMASPACSCNEKDSLLQFLTGLSQDEGLRASWQNDTDCCEWEGITCSGDGAVIEVSLAFRGLQGCISPSLGDLTNLQSLNLSYNLLTGGLPSELLASSSIVMLDVSFNHLNGVLKPQESNYSVANYRPLQELRLYRNNISGELPSALSNCTDLVTVDLKINKLSGELTKFNFSNLSNLKTLDLMENNFTGTIPESIYSCSNLTALRLSSNNLHGQLSPRIGELKSLAFLSLSLNNFTNITNTLQILKNSSTLNTLVIGDNFKGEAMPEDETIGGFLNLEVLSIPGEIPLVLNKLTFLAKFNVSNNNLEGPIPTGGQLSTFTNSSFGGALYDQIVLSRHFY
ncbi:hypothetical protein HU200_043992 [Digitaria exilis]|uniref:Leucine-rich repeat-containing N-terminal plant-type domain-containing protein n=1 Tax=Digitaria exilis TaxID=1010633 RepID=A0A835BAC5_9POAL|nr:hypothetical protein HU200_043992 [Digitaria exilis]